jgi:hypothetical protein
VGALGVELTAADLAALDGLGAEVVGDRYPNMKGGSTGGPRGGCGCGVIFLHEGRVHGRAAAPAAPISHYFGVQCHPGAGCSEVSCFRGGTRKGQRCSLSLAAKGG